MNIFCWLCSKFSTWTKYGVISKQFPKWKKVVKSELFSKWMSRQGLYVHYLFSSEDADDAIACLNLYNDYLISIGEKEIRAMK